MKVTIRFSLVDVCDAQVLDKEKVEDMFTEREMEHGAQVYGLSKAKVRGHD